MEFTWHEEKEHEVLAKWGFENDKHVFDDQQVVFEPAHVLNMKKIVSVFAE